MGKEEVQWTVSEMVPLDLRRFLDQYMQGHAEFIAYIIFKSADSVLYVFFFHANAEIYMFTWKKMVILHLTVKKLT